LYISFKFYIFVGRYKFKMKALQIDWLQFFCVVQNPSNCQRLAFKLTENQTKVFKHIGEYWLGDKMVATLAFEPKSTIIAQGGGLLKISNEVLYSCELQSIVSELFGAGCLLFVSVSRLDVALDLEHFHNNLKPENLIRGFAKEKYLHKGRAKFKLEGATGLKNKYHYLRFGKNSADISVYLYNKSKELREAKDKSYIRETWRDKGLGNNCDVWRLEVSVKGTAKKFIDVDTGEVLAFNLSNVFNTEFLERVYKSIICDYFAFVVNENKCRKDRMKPLHLFDWCFEKYNISRVIGCRATGRSERIFVKKMEELNNELRGKCAFDDLTMALIQGDIIDYFGLQEWAKRKGVSMANKLNKERELGLYVNKDSFP